MFPKLILKDWYTLLLLLCITFQSYADMSLQTEKNGFQWYLEKTLKSDYGPRNKVYTRRVYSIDKRLLFTTTPPDNVYYICNSSDNKGFFIKYTHNSGNRKYDLYNSDGQFITDLSIPGSADSNDITLINFNGVYYFIVKAYKSPSFVYGVIDEKGNTTVTFSENEITNKIYGLDHPLTNCLLVRENYHEKGLVCPNGKWIIPVQSSNRINASGDMLVLSSNGNNALLDLDGNFLIKDARNISKASDGYNVVLHNGSKGILSTDGSWILSPELGYSDFISFYGPKKATHYKVKDAESHLYGIINSNGKEILPCEFEDIEYIGGDFFKFKSGKHWGVVTSTVKVLIPTSRGYTSIGRYSTVQKTIPFTKPGYTGECNSLGRQLSLVKDTSATNAGSNANSSDKGNNSVSTDSNRSTSSQPPVKQKREKVPVQVWVKCTNCLGSGQCPYCYGQGEYVNTYGQTVDCPVCTNGKCNMCAGHGGHNEVEYH